jgi:hypothetical protein
MPSARMMSRCQIFRMNVSRHRPVFIDRICNGTRINEPATTRPSARKILIFPIIRSWPCPEFWLERRVQLDVQARSSAF